MRLWHEALIPYLPRQQLLGQHRECCALRGNGWGRKHATVNYVFEHPYGWLVSYHRIVMHEMNKRGYNPEENWDSAFYRGKNLDEIMDLSVLTKSRERLLQQNAGKIKYIYPEHNDAYLQECLDNLAGKGIHIDMGVKP